jgi:hypothetical protein
MSVVLFLCRFSGGTNQAGRRKRQRKEVAAFGYDERVAATSACLSFSWAPDHISRYNDCVELMYVGA